MRLEKLTALEKARECVGENLSGIDCVEFTGSSTPSGPWIVAVVFRFKEVALVLMADPDEDRIIAELWDDFEAQMAQRFESSSHRWVALTKLSDLLGQRLVNVWQCGTEMGHIDSLDFGFGGLLFPSLKVLCEGSSLSCFRVVPLRADAPSG